MTFLEIMINVTELVPLVQYVAKVMGGVPQSPMKSTSVLNSIFDKPISSIHLQVGQEPMIQFYYTRVEPPQKMKADCNVDITPIVLKKLCNELQFSNGEYCFAQSIFFWRFVFHNGVTI